jgi:tetratricopeptide (TPR) repeat protein
MSTQTIKQLHQQAIGALNNNEIENAHRLLVQIISLDAQHADAYFLLAMVNVNVGQVIKATKLLQKAISLNENIEYQAQLAKCYALLGELSLAKQTVEDIDASDISDALTSDTIGVALSRVGLHTDAIKYFERAILLDNQKADFHYNYGISSKFLGHIKDAEKAFERAITLNSEHVGAHFALANVSTVDKDNHHIVRLETLKKRLTNPDDLLHIGHALAREYEALNDYDNAYKQLAHVKKQKRDAIGYSFARDKKIFDVLDTQLIKNELQDVEGFDDDSAIFVVGMPRTGTTVVERMLTQAQDVYSAGELHDFAILTKQLSGEASPSILNDKVLHNAVNIDFQVLGKNYIKKAKAVSNCQAKFVDKMPLNVLYTPLILTALPKAKIICLDRNPLDIIVSNYRQLFATNFSLYQYSLNLVDTYHFYCRFKQLIQLYAKKFPDNFMLVSYEKLVTSPDKMGKKIYDFCQLEWQPEFSLIEQNKKPVDTASALQVRAPITAKNIDNWKKYEKYLDDVISCIEANGD